MKVRMPRPVPALAATGALVLAGVGGTLLITSTGSDSAPVTATCDASPPVTLDSSGSHLSVSCTVPQSVATVTATETVTPSPTPTPTPTKPASSPAVLGASLGQPLPDPQTLPAVRYYRTPTWSGSELQAEYNKGTRVFVVSTKDSTPDGMVAMLKAAPKDAIFYLTYYHEPDDNIADGSLSVATYCSRSNTFAKAVAGFSNARFGPIHNGFVGLATWKADEQGCDLSLDTYWGMDRYNKNYEDPKTQYAEGADYAKSLGLPLVIGETGASPSNASAQQTLAGQIHNWALDPANGAAVVCWWQQTGYTFANASVQHAFF